MASDNLRIARAGRDFVANMLREHGFTVNEVAEGRQVSLLAERDGSRRRVRVSSKTSGSWQTSTSYGAKTAGPELRDQTWVFVDLRPNLPQCFVVPSGWMAEDIYSAHQQYLARHGGRRAQTPSSKHHSVPESRIEQWRDRWDVVGGRETP